MPRQNPLKAIAMLPSKALDKLADYLSKKEEEIDYHNRWPVYYPDGPRGIQCFKPKSDLLVVLSECTVRALARPIQTYQDFKELRRTFKCQEH